jgi:hypothetical protein
MVNNGKKGQFKGRVVMCEYGNTVKVLVTIPAGLSYTRKTRRAWKPIDKCIAPLVKALEKGNVKMSASCCGHNKGDGRIDLQDGRVLIILRREEWEAGVSDGLTLPCAICGTVPAFDYSVDDDFWKKVVDDKIRRGVVCLPCLDKLANEKGMDVSTHLQEVQFTGINKTIKLNPTKIYQWETCTAQEVCTAEKDTSK